MRALGTPEVTGFDLIHRHAIFHTYGYEIVNDDMLHEHKGLLNATLDSHLPEMEHHPKHFDRSNSIPFSHKRLTNASHDSTNSSQLIRTLTTNDVTKRKTADANSAIAKLIVSNTPFPVNSKFQLKMHRIADHLISQLDSNSRLLGKKLQRERPQIVLVLDSSPTKGGDIRDSINGRLVFSIKPRGVANKKTLILFDIRGKPIWKLTSRQGEHGSNYDLFGRSMMTGCGAAGWRLRGTMDRVPVSETMLPR